MERTPLLPVFASEQEYESVFNDPSLGAEAAKVVAERHGITGSIERNVEGSNLVFRIGDRSWLKIYPWFNEGESDAELTGLRLAAGRLPVPVPEIEATGEIEGWPYAIVTHVEGVAIHKVAAALTPAERTDIAEKLGESVGALHAISPVGIERPIPDWPAFLAGRIEGAGEHHRPYSEEGWPERIGEYVARHSDALMADRGDLLLHADLHYEHVMVTRDQGRWRLGGIVDFADAMLGSAGYEFVDPFLWVFRGDRESQRAFVSAYGMPAGAIDDEFAELMLAWSLVHRFGRFNRTFRRELAESPSITLEELARRVVPV